MTRLYSLAVAAFLGLSATAASAGEIQISGYGGFNMSANSDVTVKYGSTTQTYNGLDWDGASFKAPPYWGVRGTYWLSGAYSAWGFAIDYSHTKVIADQKTVGADFSHFEFTDGLNLLTFNALYRMPLNDTFTPYAGLGAGINVPHVETTPTGTGAFAGQPQTWAYKFGGATLQAQVGLDAKITQSISLFTEAKFDYSFVDVGLKGGGNLKTEIGTTQLLVGASYRF